MSGTEWPTANLSNLARLRVLAAGLPGVVLHERTFEVGFEQTWAFVSDLERSVPLFDSTVGDLRILDRDGDRLRIRTTWQAGKVRGRVAMDVILRPGWCWMVSRPSAYVVGMAAEPLGGATRFALLEGFAVPGPRAVAAVLRPMLRAARWRHHRHVRRDLDGIERQLPPPDDPATG